MQPPNQPQLAPYASLAGQSRGRLHREPESATRSCYQRDRDRIIHSTALRRLKHKTQVFVYHEGDHYRTRLTHSLEVAQIARSIARVLGLDEDLAEALALAHDLGHTPFGHAGERALNHVAAEFGGFDHNAQSLRLVTRLEQRYAEFDGLNLTWETLEGLVKHNGPVTDGQGRPLGAYRDSGVPGAITEYARQQDLMLSTWPSLEAQVAALSDGIAYTTHDIDDGLRANLFDISDIAKIDLPGRIIADVRARYPGLERPRLVHETIRRLITAMIEDLLAETRARLDAAAPSCADDIRHAGRAMSAFSGEMIGETRELGDFLFTRMYRHERVMAVMQQAEQVIEELYLRFMDDPERLPAEWRNDLDPVDEARKARRICDYIAGMTDRYALAEHNRLFDGDMELR